MAWMWYRILCSSVACAMVYLAMDVYGDQSSMNRLAGHCISFCIYRMIKRTPTIGSGFITKRSARACLIRLEIRSFYRRPVNAVSSSPSILLTTTCGNGTDDGLRNEEDPERNHPHRQTLQLPLTQLQHLIYQQPLHRKGMQVLLLPRWLARCKLSR